VFSRLGISFLIFLFIAACSRVPKGIIPERKMQQVLTDMHIADAIINSDPSTFRDDEAKKALFQSVFDKHRVTEAKYDSSLIWYGKNLDVYMQVYTMALADVKRRIEIIGPIESEKTYSPNKDSVDIWTIDRYVEFSPASLSNLVVFNFQEREEYSSGSVFVLGMNVWGLASGRIPPIEVHLRAEQSDTTLIVQNSIRTDGYHELILRSVPTKRVKQVHGYIRLGNDTIPYRKIYIDNFRMMKYLYGSEAVMN
jgi:hypothetical protein